MITKTVMCPNCKDKITIQGNPGEKVQITCSKCNTKGVFKFPSEVSEKIPAQSFSIEVAGFFIIPYVYLNDLKSFLEKLAQNSYVIEKTCILQDIYENFLNLNYFREFYFNNRIINPNHVKYDDKYEIHFKFNYGRRFIDEKCSLLDFLILERIRYYSITGFS